VTASEIGIIVESELCVVLAFQRGSLTQHSTVISAGTDATSVVDQAHS